MIGSRIHHLNAGILQAPGSPAAACHCLLLVRCGGLVLVDTGIGLQDIAHPVERIGPAAIQAAGFQFHEHLTLARQIERLGFRAGEVSDIVLTHGDPDHTGGLADFPQATVHLSTEEHAALQRGGARYSRSHFAHGTRWCPHGPSSDRWFGLESRQIPLPGEADDLRLVPLFGHTAGHCGVAIRDGGRWLLHVGDAYYLRAELSSDDHPVSALAALRAEDDVLRRQSLSRLRSLARAHDREIELFGYHDFSEFPAAPAGPEAPLLDGRGG